MLSNSQFQDLFLQQFEFPPTESQEHAMQLLTHFYCSSNDNNLFILSGYAGTGKTTLVSAFVKVLHHLKQPAVLLAPTGRAGKVLSAYSGFKAFTIHKHIYRFKNQDGIINFGRRENKFNNTIFIVDEVSMISASVQSGDYFSRQSLLDDLVEYVFEGSHNKLLFIGDDAQLPPINSSESPALNSNYMNSCFHLALSTLQLKEVVRQSFNSGILFNATQLREKLVHQDYAPPFFSTRHFNDIVAINGEELEETLNDLYNNYNSDEIVLITRSNKRAIIFNQEIRNRILFRDKTIAAGDYIMAVKNNYFWIDDSSPIGFIANGDMMEIMAIHKTEELFGFHFANVTVRFCDYPQNPYIDIKIILESITAESPALSHDDHLKLFNEVSLDYEDIADKRVRFLKIKNDPFLNALQVKFAYSLTCHKTQGGQWKIVLLDAGFLKADQLDQNYLRWLYTAITRATEKVFLINFSQSFFE